MATATERIPLADHVADAVALLAAVRGTELLPVTGAAVGRIAAADSRARVDVPGHDNSQMDGYAVAAAALPDSGDVSLSLGPTIAAGDAPGRLAPHSARPIMTGAAVPAGADAIVPVEESAQGAFEGADGAGGQSERADGIDGPGTDRTVTLSPQSTAPGRFVRRRGSDTRRGDAVLREGQLLTPARLAHLAACGVAEVEVIAPVRTIVLSTGSEVTAPAVGSELALGATFDANGPGLAAALTAAGADVVHTGSVPDDADALAEHLREQVTAHDAELIVTSGGVSAGAFEVVRQAAAREDVTVIFPKVAMQPGGPQGIGTFDLDDRRVPWLAFPGNPVSALLSCELIARPALGAAQRPHLLLPVQLDADEPSPPALAQYRRARLLPSGTVRLAGGASSHLIGGLASADALVIVPVGTDTLRDGDVVETILLPGGER